MLARTDTEWGRWVIVEATNRRWARVKIFSTLVQNLETALLARGLELPEGAPVVEEADTAPSVEAATVDPSQPQGNEEA